MSRLTTALRALDRNRRCKVLGPVHQYLAERPAVQLPDDDLVALDRLTREYPDYTGDLTEAFLVAAAAEHSGCMDEDQLEVLTWPRDVLAPVHGLSETTERRTVAALAVASAVLLAVTAAFGGPTVDTHPVYDTTQEVPVR